MADDDVDTEALQAQIDLSMSFAHDLVSSWIKPTLKSSAGAHRDAENELKEYMRRPARLGVGAPIPDTQVLSRETARLKNRLSDKGALKRSREDIQDVKAQKYDDEEESRARAIKKKARVDPFGDKKKIVGPSKSPSTPQKGPSNQAEENKTLANDTGAKAPEPASALIPTPLSKRKRNETPKETPAKRPLEPVFSNLKPTISRALVGEAAVKTIASGPQQAIDVPLFATPIRPPHTHRTSQVTLPLLSQPLLNLGYPVTGDDPENDLATDVPTGSPKKKRKRRKKKKASLVALAMNEKPLGA